MDCGGEDILDNYTCSVKRKWKYKVWGSLWQWSSLNKMDLIVLYLGTTV